MRQTTINRWNLSILVILIALFLSLPAEANLLPPQISGHLSSSLTTANAKDAMKFRVDQASLTVQCQRNCEVEAEYKISSHQSAEVVLVFVLAQGAGLEVTVNGASVPVSKTSTFDLSEQILRKQLVPGSDVLIRLVMSHGERLYAAAFKAPLVSGSNTVRVNYEQSYNRDKYEYKNAAGYFSAIREFRYEFWPLQRWYLSDSFTMSVNAEFAVTCPEEDELLVKFSGWPQTPSPDIERFTPTDAKITFQKVWKHTFPGRVNWFIGAKDRLEVSKGFIKTSIDE